MTVRRLAARDLVQVVRTNLERLEPLLFRTQLHRIRGRTLRTESLDRSNAKDLVQVVRLLREVDVSPVSPSSTTGCEQSRSEMERWKILHSAKDLGVGITSCVPIQIYKTLVHRLLAVFTHVS